MAITAFWYGPGLLGQYSTTAARRVDWDADTIKVSLHTSSYSPDQDTHDFFNDATNELGAGAGYTAGGETLTTSAPAYDTGTNTLRLDAADVTWSAATFTCRYAVIYKDTGTAATSPLLGWVDFGGDESVTSGTFQIVWDTDGCLRVIAA